MGVSKLSAKVFFFKVNYSFKFLNIHAYFIVCVGERTAENSCAS